MKVKETKTAFYEKTYMGEPCYYSLTEWPNGEGYIFSVESKSCEKLVSLHLSDIDALNYLALGMQDDNN